MDKTEVEALRVEIAALYYAWGEGMKPPPVDWAKGNIVYSRAAVHSGDCTKESHACSRCLADDALAFADAVLALTPPPAGDTGEAVAGDFPMGAIENGRVFADRLEQTGLECPAGDLRMCSDWTEFRRCFEWLANWALAHPSDAALRGRVAELEAALDSARVAVVCALAFLARDLGTDRLRGTASGVIEELVKADNAIRAARARTGGTDE